MKLVVKTLFAAALVAVCFAGCKKDKKESGALGDKFPTVLNTIITPAILDTLKKHGAVINEGLTPPTVNGIYLLSPNLCTFDNSGEDTEGEEYDSYKFKFSSQDNSAFSIKVDFKDVSSSGTDEGSDGSATYISGEGNLFTIYAQIKGVADGISYTSLQLISGEVSSTGVKNFQLVNYMQTKGPDPSHYLVDEGTTRVFKDEDGLSTTQTTFANTAPRVQNVDVRKLLSMLRKAHQN